MAQIGSKRKSVSEGNQKVKKVKYDSTYFSNFSRGVKYNYTYPGTDLSFNLEYHGTAVSIGFQSLGGMKKGVGEKYPYTYKGLGSRNDGEKRDKLFFELMEFIVDECGGHTTHFFMGKSGKSKAWTATVGTHVGWKPFKSWLDSKDSHSSSQSMSCRIEFEDLHTFLQFKNKKINRISFINYS